MWATQTPGLTAKDLPYIYAKKYIKGDGVTDDRAAIRALLATLPPTGWVLDFGNMDIFVGSIDRFSGPVFTVTGHSNVRVIGKGKFLVTNAFDLTVADFYIVESQPLWRFANCENVEVDIRAEGSAIDYTKPKGLVAVDIHTTATDTKLNGYQLKVKAKKGIAAVTASRPNSEIQPASPVSTTIAKNFVVNVDTEDVRYGVRCVANGWKVAGSVRTKNAARSYFIADSSLHDVTVHSDGHNYVTDILVKSYRYDVTDVRIRYSGVNSGPAAYAPATIEHQNDHQSTKIKRIHLDIDYDGLGSASPIIVGRQFNDAGTIQATTNSVTDDIFIRFNGPQDYGRDTILTDSLQLKRGTIHLSGKFANCKKTNGFTIRRGSDLYSNNSGDFSAGGGKLYFDLDGLAVEQSAICKLEIFADSNFADSAGPEAWQTYSFRLMVGSNGAVGISGLTKDSERLFNSAVSPTMAIVSGESGDWRLVFNVTTVDCNVANARLHGKLSMLADSI